MAINTRNICWRITVPRWCLRWHNKEACQIVSIVQIQSTNDKTEQETFSKCVLCIYLQSKLFIFVTRRTFPHHFFQFGTHIYNMLLLGKGYLKYMSCLEKHVSEYSQGGTETGSGWHCVFLCWPLHTHTHIPKSKCICYIHVAFGDNKRRFSI